MVSHTIKHYDAPHQFEPLMPEESKLAPLLERASDLTRAATALGTASGKAAQVELRALLRGADVALLLAAASYRSHDYVSVLREAVPGLDLAAPPPLLCEALPVLRRVAVMAPDKVHSVKLSFSGKQLEVSSTSPDQGEARDLLEAEYEGPAMKIGFNGRYLQDAVSGVSEEKMVLQLKDEVSQVILRPEKEHNYLAIVMPMRIY